MAITFITGVARSGKSYYSTHFIYQMYKKEVLKTNILMQWLRYYFFPLPPKDYYETTFTNINELNFDFHPRLKPLVFPELIEKLTILHDLRVNQNKQDKDMIVKAKELGLHNCLFIIDEGAHYFEKPVNKVLVWWLTYHGHLFHEIHILSQHMDQIPNEYTKNGEHFYKAYAPSSAIYKNKISYGLYKNGSFFKNGKISDFSIKLIPQVYSLYVSGKLPKRKPILKKFIPIFLLLFIFLFWSVSNFFSSNDEQIQKSRQTKSSPGDTKKSLSPGELIQTKSSPVKRETELNLSEHDLSYLQLVTFNCISKICSNSKYDNVPISLLLYILENKDNPIYNYQDKVLFNFTKYYFMFSLEEVSLFDRSFLKTSLRKKSSSIKIQNQSQRLF